MVMLEPSFQLFLRKDNLLNDMCQAKSNAM